MALGRSPATDQTGGNGGQAATTAHGQPSASAAAIDLVFEVRVAAPARKPAARSRAENDALQPAALVAQRPQMPDARPVHAPDAR